MLRQVAKFTSALCSECPGSETYYWKLRQNHLPNIPHGWLKCNCLLGLGLICWLNEEGLALKVARCCCLILPPPKAKSLAYMCIPLAQPNSDPLLHFSFYLCGYKQARKRFPLLSNNQFISKLPIPSFYMSGLFLAYLDISQIPQL